MANQPTKYPVYWVYRDNRGEWRWTYYASNREEIAVSSEGYANKSDCLNAIRLMKSSGDTPTEEKS